jgi:hypothetical protein
MAGQEQVGDVDAHDEQHDRGGGHQQEERVTDVAHHLIVQRPEGDAERHRHRRLPAELRLKRVEFRRRLRHGCARREPPEHRIAEGRRLFARAEGNRPEEVNPVGEPHQRGELAATREPEGGWQHAHDVVRLAVEKYRTADDGGGSAEALAPDGVRQEHHLLTPRRVFIIPERAAEGGLHAEETEQIGGHPRRRDARRLAGARQREGDGRQRREFAAAPAALPPGHEVDRAGRQGRILMPQLLDDFLEQEQVAAVPVRGRREQERVDHGEHRGGGREPERQGADERASEQGIPSQPPNGVRERSNHGSLPGGYPGTAGSVPFGSGTNSPQAVQDGVETRVALTESARGCSPPNTCGSPEAVQSRPSAGKSSEPADAAPREAQSSHCRTRHR